MASRNLRLAELASNVDISGAYTQAAGIDVYDTFGDLPLSGNQPGDIAYIDSDNRLFLYSSVAGGGWYQIALVNLTPTITSGSNAIYDLAKDGTPTVITLEATDPENMPITWSYAVTSGTLGNTATITQSNNVFTITPSTTEGDDGIFSITFAVTDGSNIATSTSQFRLALAPQKLDFSTGVADASTYIANNGLLVTTASGTYGGTPGPTATYSLQYMFGGTWGVDVVSYWLASSSSSTGYLLCNLSNVSSGDLAKIRFYPRTRSDSFTSITSVESSADGVTFSTVPNSASGTVNSNWPANTYFDVDISGDTNRYFRVNLQYTGLWGVSMNEIEFYAWAY
jgi:hypothetical protein